MMVDQYLSLFNAKVFNFLERMKNVAQHFEPNYKFFRYNYLLKLEVFFFLDFVLIGFFILKFINR